MTITDLLPALRRLRPVAVLVAGSLVLLAIPSSIGFAGEMARVEQVRAENAAAAALEQKFVDYYRGALERLEPFGTQIVHDATAWARSGSSLLTDIDVTSLQSTASAVSGVMHVTVAHDATSAELESAFDAQRAVIQGGRERMAAFTETILTAAGTHLDAASIADSASRQAVVDTMAALEASAASREGMAAAFTALTAAVAAVDAAQAAAVAAAEAAAAAAAARRGGGTVVRRDGEPTCSSDVLTCTNQIRAFYGLGSLSGSLNGTAQQCADRLSAGAFEHTSPLPGGVHGENIARGYPSQVSVFNAWMGSPGHRANILRASFTTMGLGYASGNNWCQQFG